MLSIVLLEDEDIYSRQFGEYIQRWKEESGYEVYLKSYSSPKELENAFHGDYSTVDILFMDIELPDKNGMDYAKELREKGCKSFIIFLTSHKEFVFEGYVVQAFNFILKPFTYEQIAHNLNLIYKMLSADSYVYRRKGISVRIPYSQIILFSSSGHYVDIVTATETYKQLTNLKTVLEHLPNEFYQCHRTIIINIAHVAKLQERMITLSNGEMVPVAKQYLNDIQKEFLNFYRKL